MVGRLVPRDLTRGLRLGDDLETTVPLGVVRKALQIASESLVAKR